MIEALFHTTATKGKVKFLRKIRSRKFEELDYQTIKEAVADDDLIEALKHIPNVPLKLIPTLLNNRFLLHSGTLPHWVELSLKDYSDCQEEIEDFSHSWYRTRLYARILRLEQMDRLIYNCKTPEELMVLEKSWDQKKKISQNYLDARIKARDSEQAMIRQIILNGSRTVNIPDAENYTIRFDSNKFPKPPLPGTEYIQPIVDIYNLEAEAGMLKNCCAGGDYRKKIKAGNLYLYRILQPERCLISIKRTANGWRIDEMKKACNEKVGKETRQIARKWVRDCTDINSNQDKF